MAETSLDTRVQDYLDDKFQTLADLDDLDQLLANVEHQRNQLQAQLDSAVLELDNARRTADGRHDSLAAQIADFRSLQTSIDRRVTVAAASDAPSRAIARLQEPMKKLHAVELAQRYLALLQDAQALREQARAHLPESPRDALGPYTALREMALRMRDAQGAEEALYIVDYVDTVASALWEEMKATMSGELEAVLAKRAWPKVDPHSEMDEEWLASVEKLIDLQMPEVLHSDAVVSLLPFDVMASIIIAEFRFHFLGDKPTSNSQSIATYCFPWVLTTIEKWSDFFRDNLGHLLASKFHDTSAASNSVYIDPSSAYITSLLPVVREKVELVAEEALTNPSFLSSFVPKLMKFDNDIRDNFNYDGGDPEHGWPGLADGVLEKYFDAWFQAERTHALERLEKIMESPDARKIDYEYATQGRMKPTFAAVRITDLMRSVTTQYEQTRKFKHKIRFLIDIQLDILDGYHDRLRGSLEAYQSITSTLGRTLHGASKEQLAALEGTGVLETLCKVIGSADHVATTLTEWSDDEFFATLWDQLQSPGTKPNQQDQITSTMSFEDVKERTSNTNGEEGDGALFDETVAAYSSRRKVAEDLLVLALTESHSKAFKAYLSRVQWTTVGEAALLDDPSQLSITPELDEPLRILRRNFTFLTTALSTASLRRVFRESLEKLQDTLWTSVLLRHSFTTLGAAQFAHDIAAVLALVDGYIPGGSSAMDALRDGTVLLSLPAEGTMTLKEASDRAFTDNEEARGVLEELGLTALTPVSARKVLQRRVENNENIGW